MEKVEFVLERDELDEKASYLARGRRFQLLTDQAFIELWIAYLRREFVELAKHRADGNDLRAEISIRGMRTVEMPEDVREAMRAEAARLWLKYTVEPMN